MGVYTAKGITLLEIMLVLAIASSFLLMGFGMYRTYKTESDFNRVKQDVEVIFQLFRQDYQKNCSTMTSASSSTPYFVNGWPSASNPVVDTDPPIGVFRTGYAGKYISVPSIAKNQYVCSTSTTGVTTCSTPTPIANSSVVLWKIQVVAKIRDPILAQRYQAFVGADCVIDSYNGSAVSCPGSPASATAQFLVWQRLPSFASPRVSSGLWSSTPVVKEFNLQYTNDPMYEMNSNSSSGSYYYTCGG